MTTDPKNIMAELEKKLGQLRENEYLPPELVRLVGEVARRQDEAQAAARFELPDPAVLTSPEENLQGRPLLARESFPADRDLARALFDEFLNLLTELGGDLEEAAGVVRTARESGELDLERALDAFLSGDDAWFAAFGQRTPNAPRVLNFLVQAALTPGLAAAAARLAEGLDLETPRQHGHCPVCGSLPLISNLEGKEGRRQVTCSFCRTSYRVRRLACPFCDHADPQGSRSFTVQEIPGYRVEVCDSCRSYMKTADFREMDRPSVPVLNDLESLPLDYLAQKQGFRRPTLSAWGF
ncbi:formate dehydrogenase accessory protein FdhE [Desulfovibrio aminophilus]|uniref:formate dehydrogenase accessory protein FdhE n=1 Tax=Desulfovibrio aminophilus TaxID=81425 RepID=UPI003391AC4A